MEGLDLLRAEEKGKSVFFRAKTKKTCNLLYSQETGLSQDLGAASLPVTLGVNVLEILI